MRSSIVAIVLVLVACNNVDPSLGADEQELASCTSASDCDTDPLDCTGGVCTDMNSCAFTMLTGTPCYSDNNANTYDVCSLGACTHVLVAANSCQGKCGQPNTAGQVGGCSCEPGCENAPYIYDPGNHWGNSGCCADMATYCSATLASASSCRGRCGERAPGGCSCEATCGYTGTCCADMVGECPATAPIPEFPNPLAPGAGSELFQSTPAVGVAAGVQSDGPENLGVFLRFKRAIAPVARSVVGFTKLNFNMVEAFDEEAHCRLIDTTGSQMRLVQAGTRHHDDRDELHVACKAAGLRFPDGADKAPPTVGAEVAVEQHNGGGTNSSAVVGTISANNIAVLTYMQVGNTDQNHPATCKVIPSGTSWTVQAGTTYDSNFSGDGSDAWCAARLVTWDPALGVNREPDVEIAAPYEAHRILGSVYGRRCFLSGMTQTATKSTCELTTVNDDWVLNIKAGGVVNESFPIRCRATCLTYPTEWPRTPDLRGIATTDPSLSVVDARVPLGLASTGGGEQPSQPADLPLASGGGPGGVLDLFRSKDGLYDRPLLIVEGYNPSNDQGAEQFMRGFAPVLRTLQDRYGIDIWVLKPSGNRDIRVTAREIAKALSNIYTYDPDGSGPAPTWNVSPAREFPVIGFSQGALGTRIALATWEEGDRYQNPAYGEYIPNLYPIPTPPVSLFLSIGGPQREALGSPTIQATLVNVLNGMSALALPSSIRALLSSTPAQQMLRWSVAETCRQVVTQYCDSGTLGDLYNLVGPNTSGQQVRGLSGRGHYDFATNGDWAMVNQSSSQNTGCGLDQQTHNAFYADVDARGQVVGINRNGYPQTVHSVAMSNGSFSPQGCKNFDGRGCTTQTPYNVTIKNGGCDYASDPNCNMSNMPDATTFVMNPDRFIAGGAASPFTSSVAGIFKFYFTGMTALGTKACDRDTTVHFLLGQDDLTPGDHRGTLLESIIDAIPPATGQVTLIDGQDYFPLVFVPTESALSCAGTIDTGSCVLGSTGQRSHDACDAICRTANRNAGRFKNVLSNPSDKNGYHGGLNSGLAAAVMAYVYEFSVQDADGYFDAANEWGVPTGEQLDCNSTNASIGSSATASCVTSCGSTGTKTCGGGAWGSCMPPTETCNGIDDNCDGNVDEGCVSGGGGRHSKLYY